jgi:NitT/TauT family transport system substrate-binding protein
MIRATLRVLSLALVAILAIPSSAQAQQVQDLRIGRQPGLAYLPLIVVERQRLVEKHAAAAGLGSVRSTTVMLGSAAAIAETLLSGNVEIVTGAITPMLVLWDRTRGNQSVRGVAQMGSSHLTLTTVNPNVRTLRDFTQRDRIAVSAVGVSLHAILIQMAAAAEFGPTEFKRLDTMTTSMSHPDATQAILSGRSEITGHLPTSPFREIQLRDPRVRRVLGTEEILGGPAPAVFAFAMHGFRNRNPALVGAFIAAADEAVAWINADIERAARLYLEAEPQNARVEEIVEMLRPTSNSFATVPRNTMRFADFMHRNGQIRQMPASWRDLFVEEVHNRDGS